MDKRGRLRSSNIRLFFAALFGVFVRRRSRVFTALLAASLGATAFFGLLAIYYDLPLRLSEVFRVYGANIALVSDKAISKEDVEKAKELLPRGSLVGAAPYAYKSALLNLRQTTTAYADLQESIRVNPYWQIEGELPKGANEAVAGYDLADMLQLKVGSSATLENQEITISAIVKTGGATDGFLYMNIGENYAADLVELSVSLSGEALEAAKNALANNLSHITPKLVKRVASSETAVLGKLKALMTFVTIAAIALTMICVSSTMAATVLERQKEIGLKKAIGAENRDIALEFLSEAIILGLIGGVFGSLFGYAFANFASYSVFGASIDFDFGLAIVSIAVSAVFTAAAAIFPVYSATNIDPIVVLRGE
ncbi:MAG: FtsX-like permease family protein [Helicobacteraceae bacterium]|jgi:putative ABC transport system permease protein|nr:FtsX-like permease family protein [Helicobacteraceae bacterium]